MANKTLSSVPTRNIDDFYSKAQTVEQQFRKAVASRERIFIPPKRYILSEPIEFEHALLLKGHFGKFYSRDLFPATEILADRNLKGRPTIHRKGFYLSHDDIWMTSDDKVANLVECAAVGTGLTVQVEDIAFQTQHEDGCNMQVYNSSIPTYVKNCSFGQSFRGLMMVNTFGAIIENCAFQGKFDYPWLADLERVKRGWGLCVGNNCTIVQCNWQGGLTGLQCIGTGNNLIGGRIERMIYGLRLGFKNLNPDGQFGGIWATNCSTFAGFTLESNLFGIDVRANVGTRLSEFFVTGTNAPQLDGKTSGHCEYGINAEYLFDKNIMQNCAVSGEYRKGAIIGNYFPGSGIVKNNSLQVVVN